MKPHLALVHLDLFIGVSLPGELLQLLCCVLTCLQVGLDDVLSNTVWMGGLFVYSFISFRTLRSFIYFIHLYS